MSTIKRKRIKPAAVSDRTQRRRHEALVAHLALIRMDTSALLSGYNMLSQRMESLRTVVDHCTRLLKEKETLQRQVEMLRGAPDNGPTHISDLPSSVTMDGVEIEAVNQQRIPTLDDIQRRSTAIQQQANNQALKDANGFVSIPALMRAVSPVDCAVSHLHRLGVRCAVCGA
jgi:hypothetical protein